MPERTSGAWRLAASSLARSASTKPVVSDDVSDAGLSREGREADRRRRGTEIEHALGGHEGFERVLGHGNADRPYTGQHAGILAQRGGSGSRQRRRQGHAVRPSHGRNQHPTHAPRGTGDDEPHVGH